MSEPYSVLNVLGPFREPREPVFSFDYSVQRPTWATPQGIRIKIAIDEELNILKTKIMGQVTGSPGQQLRINQIVLRAIADTKLHIANDAGMFLERRDIMIEPFTDTLSQYFPQLVLWAHEEGPALRQRIHEQVGLGQPSGGT